jgi:hypothetical protein
MELGAPARLEFHPWVAPRRRWKAVDDETLTNAVGLIDQGHGKPRRVGPARRVLHPGDGRLRRQRLPAALIAQGKAIGYRFAM